MEEQGLEKICPLCPEPPLQYHIHPGTGVRILPFPQDPAGMTPDLFIPWMHIVSADLGTGDQRPGLGLSPGPFSSQGRGADSCGLSRDAGIQAFPRAWNLKYLSLRISVLWGVRPRGSSRKMGLPSPRACASRGGRRVAWWEAGRVQVVQESGVKNMDAACEEKLLHFQFPFSCAGVVSGQC